MKKSSLAILLFALVGVSSLSILSCTKTFEGVTAVLSNNYIKQRVSVRIINANSKAANPYPANTVLTLSGTDIDNGLIYSDAGTLLTAAVGSAKAISNTLTLVVKPYTNVSANRPITFTIKAEAPGYLSANKAIVITSLDSMQYVDVKMVEIASLPSGIAVAENISVVGTNNGTVSAAATLPLATGSGAGKVTQATLAVPANTQLQDVNGAVINSSAPLKITASTYNNSSSDAVQVVPGGLFNVLTTDRKAVNFNLGAAIDINASLGSTEVKKFSTPLKAELQLPASTFNTRTGNTIVAGDSIEVWSNSGVDWKKEGMAKIVSNGSGGLKVAVDIKHLSTWIVAYKTDMCASPLTIDFNGPASIYYLELKASPADGGQFLVGEAIALEDKDTIICILPTGMNYTINFYAGSTATGTPVRSLSVYSCSQSATLNYSPLTANPILSFNLETKCSNGIFRYSGPIDYKVNGTTLWNHFTPSTEGTLTTSLLEWNMVYDFRVVYNGTSYTKTTKQVLKTEFRNTSGDLWSYWGRDPDARQTNFITNLECK